MNTISVINLFKIISLILLLFFYLLIFSIGKEDEKTTFDIQCLSPAKYNMIDNLSEVLNKHNEWFNNGRHGDPPNLSFTLLNKKNLQNANLRYANLKGAKLNGANLQSAKLDGANLICAELRTANLNSAKLMKSELMGARLDEADLSFADLYEADLSGAHILRTNLDYSDMQMSSLAGSTFEPFNVPPAPQMAGVKGLKSLRLSTHNPNPSGMKLFIKALIEGGFRSRERNATFSLEQEMDNILLRDFLEAPFLNALSGLKYILRYFAFNYTTQYGAVPFNAIVLVIRVMFIFTIFYFLIIWKITRGIDQILKGNIHIINSKYPGTHLNADPHTNISGKLQSDFIPAIFWAQYFSLLSAVTFGFRDFNLSQWIERIQPTPFVLIPTGCVRLLSGIQSVLCLYLIVIFILTQFTRLFQ